MSASPYFTGTIAVACAICASRTEVTYEQLSPSYDGAIGLLRPRLIWPPNDLTSLRGQLWTCVALPRNGLVFDIVPHWPETIDGQVLPDMHLRKGGYQWTCRSCSASLWPRLHSGRVSVQIEPD
jgi:hypothetical protein